MSDISTLLSEIVARLQGKTALRGVRILSIDDHSYLNTLAEDLARTRGVAVTIGNPSGVIDATNVPGGAFAATVRAYVFENQVLNRERTLSATVANEAARLALSGITVGTKVRQTDVGLDYWLIQSPESVAANWGQVLVATQILQLVIRSLQLWQPSGYQTITCQGFEPGTLEDIHDYVARFRLQIGLDSSAVP